MTAHRYIANQVVPRQSFGFSCMCNQGFECSRYCLLAAMMLQPGEAHNVVEEEKLSFALDHHHALLPHGVHCVKDGVNIIRDRVEVAAIQVGEKEVQGNESA